MLARRLGDLELAEDAVQDAFARAVIAWPRDGVPDRPGAWLTTVAWRRALDLKRNDRRLVPCDQPLGEGWDEHERQDEHDWDDLQVDDDVLGLLLACCHPALSLQMQVALTLRHVAGLTAAQIAAAFLVTEEAMAKRLVRARARLRDSGSRFAVPAAQDLPGRLLAVRTVILLVFTEGHSASSSGAPVRMELCDEAVWLAEQLHALVPADPETTGLLALLLLTDARSPARQDAAGRLLTFAEQDRERWDETKIGRARILLGATGLAPPGPLQVQAAIAALHVAAAPGQDPDWQQLAALHEVLARLEPSAVTEVNRAMVVGRARGSAAGLAVLAPVLAGSRLERYAPLHAVHADLLDRAGRKGEAAIAWARALACASNDGQRAEIERRLGLAVSSTTDAGSR